MWGGWPPLATEPCGARQGESTHTALQRTPAPGDLSDAGVGVLPPGVTTRRSFGVVEQVAEFTLDVVLDAKSLSVEENADGDLYVEGWASDWQEDRDGEAFEPTAYSDGLKNFMASNPILLWNHRYGDDAIALGQVVKAKLDDAKGVWIRARLDRPEPGTFAADIFRKVKRGTLRAFSVGGKMYRRLDESGRRLIHKIDLMEISIVPVPANSRTLFAAAKTAFGHDAEIAALQARVDAVREQFAAL